MPRTKESGTSPITCPWCFKQIPGYAETVAERDALREALTEIVRRERRSEYSSIYAAPGEFAAVALAALGLPE